MPASCATIRPVITLINAVPSPEAVLGVLRAESVEVSRVPAVEAALGAVLARRNAPLDADQERCRQAVRALLRRGRYKPTGRGKPASEYLLRSAAEATFPRILPVVDAANLVSLESLLPISLWDLDRAGATCYRVRAGRPGESYAFNAGGQTIELEDLLVGCRVTEAVPEGEPILSPVKDSLATKTTPETRRVAALVYAPAADREALERAMARLAGLLAECAAGEVRFAVVEPGASAEI